MGTDMEPTGNEQRIIRAFARRFAAGFPHSVIWVKDLVAMTGLEAVDLDRAIDALIERGWLMCAGNGGWQHRDFCALIGEGSIRARALIGEKAMSPVGD